ncbi:hypothetical protein P3102_14960 [Amycolatopsis sp. QT-25]|uniref:hypothetical protein n=1 Tax=Amycolatopsis sp. QT-25 TaxID=3034022 RepID=UPI0023EDAF6D|nr:hypothetical protein [Amycolatopsis sp. QT-25]WET82409.1 hypothetical protein P3102_14960 [Amycolatopsis sp. QT-25]
MPETARTRITIPKTFAGTNGLIKNITTSIQPAVPTISRTYACHFRSAGDRTIEQPTAIAAPNAPHHH